MFEWLIPLLIVVVILIKILDSLDLLDIVTDALRLVLAAIMGTVKLAIRKLVTTSKPQP